MRTLLVGLLLVVGCHRASQSGSSPKEADALWALAPEGTELGIVATPRALAMLEHGWQDVHAFVAKAPDLAPFSKIIDQQLEELTGAPDFKLADFGLTSEKGGAVFVIGADQVVMVIPLADREKFLAKAHGTKGSDSDKLARATCKTIKGVYACASTDDLFGKLGKAKLRDQLDARGDIEVVAQGIAGMPMKSVAGVVQLERGAAVVRATFVGLPASAIAQLGAPIKPVVDRDHSAGFGVVNLGAFLSQMPDVPIGAGVSTLQLAHSLAGPLTMSVPAGELGFDIRIALTDPGPAQTLVEHCAELVPAAASPTFKDGTCHVQIPVVHLGADAWLDGKTLRIGIKNAPPAKAVALTRFGSELAEGSWSFAFWGRGSMLAVPALPFPPEDAQDPQTALGLHTFTLLDELGVGVRADGDRIKLVGIVRTAWSNPDDVVTKLAQLNPLDVVAGKGPAFAKTLPGDSPLAHDVEAGYAGLVLPFALIGVASAVAIPAFVDYTHRSRTQLVEPPPPSQQQPPTP